MAKAVVSIKLNQDYPSVRLRVSTTQDLANPIYSQVFATTNTIAKVTIDGLQANTQYYYGVVIHGTLQTQGRGKFKTFPASASSFTCAFGSCAPVGNNNTVFDDIRNSNPLFFIHMGDMHYANITTNSISLFRDAYNTVFDQSRQAALYANIPTMYMWDDHDFSANDGDGTSPSKPAAQAAYKERVPHYPLPATDGGTYQSWVVGRVRFILTDLMSYKTPMGASDTTAKTQFGETQLQWFFNELTKPEPLKIWINTKPFIGDPAIHEMPSDKWWGFTAERNRIANFIKTNNLQGKVAIISGDMHGVAIDDGTNSDYATGGGGKIPVFQAAPLGSNGSVKGGGWSHGSFTNGTLGNQWGEMVITDAGTSANITMQWNGKRNTSTLVTWSMSVPSAPYVKPAGGDTTPPVVTASPNGGTFTNTTSVTLSANESATIYYTTNGSTPTLSSTVYSAPITLTATTALKFFAVDTSGNQSAVQTVNFTNNGSAPTLPAGGLMLHYNATAGNVTVTGGDVTAITDLSGNNRNGVAGTGTFRAPALLTGTYAHPVIDFAPDATGSGIGESIEVASFAPNFVNANEYTMVYVGVMDNYAVGLSQKMLDFSVNATTAGLLNFSIQGSSQSLQVSRGANTAPAFSLPTQYTANKLSIFSVTSSAEAILYLDGVEKARTTVSATTGELNTITQLRIGGRFAGASPNHFDGKIGEVIVYNRALSAAEMTQLHDYLKSKWSIT